MRHFFLGPTSVGLWRFYCIKNKKDVHSCNGRPPEHIFMILYKTIQAMAGR